MGNMNSSEIQGKGLLKTEGAMGFGKMEAAPTEADASSATPKQTGKMERFCWDYKLSAATRGSSFQNCSR